MHSEEIRNLRRKLKRARENGKLQEISDYCCSLAAYLSDLEEHEEALNLYKESLSVCDILKNKKGIALSNRMIAEECTSLGYFDEALEHVTLFLKYAEEEGDKVEEQRGLVLKGHVYFTQAEYLMGTKPKEYKTIESLLEKSMEAYRKSFAICTTDLIDISEKERLQMKARLLQNKSLVLIRQNKLDQAQTHLIRAIKICTKEKLNDTEHICYLSLGDLYTKKGEPHKALNVYDRVFQLAHSTAKKRDALVEKAKTHIAMENYSQAKAVLKNAYKLRVDDEIKRLIKQVATILRIEESLCSISESDLITRKNLYKKLGDICSSLKNYKKAIKSYLNMLGCVQKAESSKSDLINCYVLLRKAFINDKQYDKALFYSNQEAELLSKSAPERACKTFLKIAKLHELNCSDFEEVYFAYDRAKTKAQKFKNQKLYIKCLKQLINMSNSFNKPDLVKKYEEELKSLKSMDDMSESSCESEEDSDSEITTDSEENSGESSDTDIKQFISDSDIENEEYDRPKERCKRTNFKIKRNEKGETDLHIAAIKGNYKRVKLLIEKGHPVNVRDTAGWTPLHEACNYGYVDIVNILLDFGADINDKGGPSCEGITPLHDAAINGQLKVLEMLIKRGASTVVLNDSGQTPLQCLLTWKKKSALDEDEELAFQKIVKFLKSPLDSEDIKRHIQVNKSLSARNSDDSTLKKSFHDFKSFDIIEKKTSKSLIGSQKTSAVTEYKETMDLLRRKRQATGESDTENFSDNSDGSDDCFGKAKKILLKDDFENNAKEAKHMLKKFRSSCTELEKKPALIDEKEYVDNCIMDNDDDNENEEESQKDKRKRIDKRKNITNEEPDKVFDIMKDGDELERKTTRLLSSPLTISKKPSFELECKTKPWLKNIPLDLLEDSFEIPSTQSQENMSSTSAKIDEVNMKEGSQLERKTSKSSLYSSLAISKKPSFELECKTKQWLKNISIDLLEDSFELPSTQSQDVSSSIEKVDEVISNQISCEKSTFPISENENIVCDTIDLNIKLMNETIKISIKKSEVDKLKVSWLFEEAGKQHTIIRNTDYYISLRVEGADVSESNSLASILNKRLEFFVTKWKSLALDLRYQKACTVIFHKDIMSEPQSYGFKHSPLPQVLEILKRSTNSRCLNLSNLKLSSLTLIPICKAIKHETFIQNLNLSNNYFGDKGIELIVKVLESCIIEELNISGCNITLSGVYYFNESLDRLNELSRNGLEILNLSHNPLTDGATEALYSIMEKLPNLRVFHLDHCEMEVLISTKNSCLSIIQDEKFKSPNRSTFIETES